MPDTTATILVELTPPQAHLIRRALVRLGLDEGTDPADRRDVIALVGYLEREEDAQ